MTKPSQDNTNYILSAFWSVLHQKAIWIKIKILGLKTFLSKKIILELTCTDLSCPDLNLSWLDDNLKNETL